MKFPDPNVGYLFGYESRIIDNGILITFLGGLAKILFRFEDVEYLRRETYRGGRISWDVLRWGKCQNGKEALKVFLKKGIFRNNLVVFDDLDAAVASLNSKGMHVK